MDRIRGERGEVVRARVAGRAIVAEQFSPASAINNAQQATDLNE